MNFDIDTIENEYTEKKLKAEAGKKKSATLATLNGITGLQVLIMVFGKPVIMGEVNKVSLVAGAGIVILIAAVTYITGLSISTYSLRKYNEKLESIGINKRLVKEVASLKEGHSNINLVTPKRDRHEVLDWKLTEYKKL